MHDPPGTIPPPQQKVPHSRRPPAHQSVSLRHSPPGGRPSKAASFRQPQPTSLDSPNPPASDQANPPSSTSPKLQSNKYSSGESSDAGKWFESTNAQKSNASFADNDPPFFLRNSSSSETPPEGTDVHRPTHARPSIMPYRPGIERLETEGSSSEDFRSVIDDLTVVNKKLKQKLRKYEKMYDAHLQDEKLFEVRFHGLSDHKKKELEETLRNFAANLDDSPPQSGYPQTTHQPAAFHAQKTASSLASRFAESGYASMSASGQNSVSAPSNQTSQHPTTLSAPSKSDGNRRRLTKSQYNRQQADIHTYLHDIPSGLLPHAHAPMSDKAKKKLVVRRLEQVFAGKRSAPGNHQQPEQQEEVAQSAALADRQAKEATGETYKSEGHREARMVSAGAQEDDLNAATTGDFLQKLRPHLSVNEQDFAGYSSPDQRPTRPLDLDPYRAQVPSENMEYIRHLGFTPPDMVTGEAPQDGHGWLYLNLLVNMAQLHTLNVTPDFVKDALLEYSSKFELSPDGRRIRWRGGHDVTLSSGDSSSEHLSGNSAHETLTHGHDKQPSTEDPEQEAKRVTTTEKQKERDLFTYTPLFHHKESSEEDINLFDVGSSSNSPYQIQQPANSSGFGSSAMNSSSSRRKRDDGPIIFYKANFCTDLTGDRHVLARHDPDDYASITTQPLGVTRPQPSTTQQHQSDTAKPRRSLEMAMDLDAQEERSISTSETEIEFSPAALKNDSTSDNSDVMEFEASGLGGVQPDDNFSIKVRRSQTMTATHDKGVPGRKHRLYPKKILKVLEEEPDNAAAGPSHKPHSIIKEEILSASRKSLPSSTLPPASFLPFDSTSSGDVDSDLDDDSDVSSGPSEPSSSESNPATTLQFLNISPHNRGQTLGELDSGNESSSEDNDYDSDNDGSIDFLATARKVDPYTINASEREYDAAFAERLAEEIPAGSSAATAGGGSGFNSPIGGHESDPISQVPRTHRQSTTSGSMSSRTRNLKRSRTRESLGTAAQGTKGEKSQKIE